MELKSAILDLGQRFLILLISNFIYHQDVLVGTLLHHEAVVAVAAEWREVEEEEEVSAAEGKHLIPVLGKVVAGYPIEAVENILDYEEISDEMAQQGDFFALQVKGDSMEPRIKEGDVVIVRKQEDVDSGDIAIMLVNGDEATIKKVQKFSGGINLIPSNSSYEVITYTNKEVLSLPVRCLGKVVELRAKF